jgi:hypothetical protein
LRAAAQAETAAPALVALAQPPTARKPQHPATIAYIERRIAEGKTPREATRCLKRYTARHLYRRLNAITNTP